MVENRDLICRRQPPLIRNAAGYYLRGVLAGSKLSVPRLLVGSEGTLGLFTAATLHTSVLPPHRAVALLLFGDLESAIRAVQEIAEQEPSACDLMDRRLLSLAREADSRFEQLIAPTAEVALIVEQIGFSDAQCRDRIQMVIRAVRALNVNAVVAYQAHTFEDVEFLWTLPGKVVPLLTRLKGQTRPTPIVEDIAVPPAMLLDFLRSAQKVFQSHEVTASLYSHAAAGQLHLRPFLAPPSPAEGPKLEALARDLYAAVFAVGGTVSGEHGDGMSRTAFLRTEYGQLYRVFEEVKEIFDPKHVLNPGKIVGNDVRWPREQIRPTASGLAEPVPLQLRWSEKELLDEALTCNGCGQCKTQSPGSRMCPFFRIESREEASPRSKANVLRDYLTGRLDPREWTSESMKSISDLCFNCKQCQLECPTNVNIPQMMIEAKASQVAAHGITRADWILSRAHSYRLAGKHGIVGDELGHRQPGRAMVYRTSRRNLTATEAAAVCPTFVLEHGSPGNGQTAKVSPRPHDGYLFRGRLRQFSRSATGAGAVGRVGAQRNFGLRPAGPNVVRNGHDFGRGFGGRPHRRRPERGRAR